MNELSQNKTSHELVGARVGQAATLDQAVDAALAGQPVAPLPAGFLARTMARIEPVAPARATPRPHLAFLDLALPLFATLLVATALALATRILAVDPLLAARASLWLTVTWDTLLPGVPRPGGLALSSLAAAVGVLVLSATMVLERAVGRAHSGPVASP